MRLGAATMNKRPAIILTILFLAIALLYAAIDPDAHETEHAIGVLQHG